MKFQCHFRGTSSIFGEVQVSHFVAEAAFGEVPMSLFVVRAAFGEILNDSRGAKMLYFSIQNARGEPEE